MLKFLMRGFQTGSPLDFATTRGSLETIVKVHGDRQIRAVVALAMGFAAGAVAETPGLAPCSLPGFDGPARCGEIQLPENSDKPDGRSITISFAVLPATGGPARPDPIVPLYGGPGEQVISEAAYVARQFATLRGQRDIVLVDQRGTGRSGALRCLLFDPASPATSLQHFVPPQAVRDLRARPVRPCGPDAIHVSPLRAGPRAHSKGARLFAVQLYAGSYGTRAAQVYLRAFPQSIRTVILSSVVPPDFVTPLTMAKASQAQFEATFAACEADSHCKAAYPRLRQEFEGLLVRLDAGRVRASVPGATDATLGRGRVVEWLRGKLYRPSTAAELPWLIHQAHADNWSPIVDGILAQAREIDAAYSLGLWFAITCSDDVAFLREEDVPPQRTAPTSATIGSASSRRHVARGRKQAFRPTTANPCARRSRRCSCRVTWMRQRRSRSPRTWHPDFRIASRSFRAARATRNGTSAWNASTGNSSSPASPEGSVPRARRSRGRPSSSRKPA